MLHQNPPKYSFNHQKIIIIALAYVGVITGAGLSSGQEIFQYFASFGKMGMIGVVILGILHAIFGGIFWHWVRFIVPMNTAKSLITLQALG